MVADKPGIGDERRLAFVGLQRVRTIVVAADDRDRSSLFNGRSIAGWLLSIAGAVIIFVGILTNLEIYFRPTSLFNTVLMLALLAGGIGLVARSLRAIPARTPE